MSSGFPGRGALVQTGRLFTLGLEVTWRLFQRPLQVREFVEQAWFVTRVSVLPTALFTIPFGATIALLLSELARQFGAQSQTGAGSVLAIVQQAVPIVTALLVASAGGTAICADLGARTIREEIAALEVMSVPSVPYLITTRVVAGFVAIIPMYTIGLVMSYAGSRLNVTVIDGLPGGTYDHYFTLFLPVSDVLWSYVKVLAFAFVIILICCHYGYRASGGPAGVGIAVGRAVRACIVIVAIIDFFLNLAIFGTTTSVRVAG